MAKSNLATRQPPPGAAEQVDVAAVVPGQTVIVLKNGAILAGRLMPTSIRRDKDALYDVIWNIELVLLASPT